MPSPSIDISLPSPRSIACSCPIALVVSLDRRLDLFLLQSTLFLSPYPSPFLSSWTSAEVRQRLCCRGIQADPSHTQLEVHSLVLCLLARKNELLSLLKTRHCQTLWSQPYPCIQDSDTWRWGPSSLPYTFCMYTPSSSASYKARRKSHPDLLELQSASFVASVAMHSPHTV